jgi:hypothetical protein
MNKKYSLSTLTKLDVLDTTFSDEELLPIKNEIKEIQTDFQKSEPFNIRKKLAGHIKKEYALIKTKDYLEKLTFPFVHAYMSDYFQEESKLDLTANNLKLEEPWVNFQKKYEFNPYHEHSQILSMVLWISIPYLYEDEENYYPDVNHCKSGTFEFQFTNYLGENRYRAIPTDKKYENTMIIFPSKLRHCVYPFYTSDDYRISISGNFSIDNDSKTNIISYF